MDIVLLGESNAGKTTIANNLVKNHGYQKITPVDNLKRHLEKINNLDPFSLDTQEGKNKKLTNGITYGKLLVDLFFFWDVFDPLYSAKNLEKSLEEGKSSSPIVFDSIRTYPELKVLMDSAETKFFLIEREGSIVKPSDRELLANLERVDYVTINNNRCIKDVIWEILNA